ncbi:aminopeptidase D (aminoacyl-histidine dipeptidase) [Xenorhabdus nematophila ATCC 19061]|uniref:Cytosol non-specific dipeptidase n=1 Tax=Xenorhabdus nematophila (strain ATCC 19061 / DSM 3370 / CCUG 14189 / LMG 1036 / NCIMB 9965 / AN6) TaxID=406817 RepID=D3V9T4_XENNA|nr:beta-Ala-His dipeptidase [Xenorhabdus nematophila]CBJ89322.1 aminopeptidase D (aminoacyl-histidine dipeptidase) [Xenorhabdus nematophila ATCC 19061]CEE95032.1 aminopeptidase D (aminoacyl-histidine dipeptidase) [Xenorhabdus nematophila str. Anatoliense]CEE95354.1 aminopeptidase D (aminoacyl-histidine dipeptidase) [Xenorhabdus nematophila str. Anatoliense]CEK22222.1 aminopeptidase D (aminoacyl-histidine dipeptidase) [Xenorhabdus nematophila AN6/1]
MSGLSTLSPQLLWDIFAQICSIPHPSYHEEALASHIIEWAKNKEFHVERDEVGNILIRKPASKGMENRKAVVLQAHLDMVPQKNNDTQHDFAQDPIRPYIDGDWITADGTTLGADNGIGMASALAVLADESVKHGPLEVLLTMTEEAGMDGAFGLKSGWLQADILINTDSEEEGEIYMGCAGGIDFVTTLTLSREALPTGYKALQLTIKGLKGGHSGGDIHLGLGNANKLLARFLSAHADDLNLKLIHLQGGTLRNAIPRESSSIIAVPADKLEKLHQLKDSYLETLKNEYAVVETNLTLLLEEIATSSPALTQDCQTRFLSILNTMPNGVIRMSDVAKGVVETSLNVGVVAMNEEKVEIICLIRSLIESGKTYVVEMLHSLATLSGAETIASGSYPGWQPDANSPVMHLVRETYHQLFDKTPNIMVIHAGLECGLFKKPYPDMDMVSIGPTIRGAHSPDEKVHIKSVGQYWQLLTAILKSIPVKESY